MPSDRPLRFGILGPLEVRDGPVTVRIRAAKQRALLGVLLLRANEAVSVQHLVDELWGERSPATAEKLVQGYVHALRRTLGDGALETHPPGYLVRADATTLDLLEFDALIGAADSAEPDESVELRTRALQLWRGPPLADVVLEGPDRHLLPRLNERRLTTQIALAESSLERGRHAQLVGELEQLAAEHPYQERIAALLMLALYRSGRQADALEVFRTMRRRLSEDLGLEPSQELRDLEAAILRQDDALAAPALVGPEPAEAASGALEPALAEAPRRRRFGIVAAAALVLAGAAVTGAVLARGDPPVVVAPNTVAVLDVDSNRVVDTVSVGIRPGPVAAGGEAIWVANLEDQTLSRIDPVTRDVVKNIALPATPDAVAFGAGAVWVVNGRLGMLYRVDTTVNEVTKAIRLGDRSITHADAGVDVARGFVWAAFGDSSLARADAFPLRALGIGSTDTGPAAVLFAFGSVWVANSGSATVQRFNPLTFEEGPVHEIGVGPRPTGLAAGAGTIWVTSAGGDYVTRIDAGSGFNASRPIVVGDGPTDVAFGEDAAWVANAASRSISRIDPEENAVVETIPVGNPLGGLAVADGYVWTSVQAP